MKNLVFFSLLFLLSEAAFSEGAASDLDLVQQKVSKGLYSLKWNPYYWPEEFTNAEFEAAHQQYELQNYEKAFLRFRRLFAETPSLTRIRAAYYMGMMHLKKEIPYASNKEAFYFLKYADKGIRSAPPGQNFYSAAAQYELSRFFSDPAFIHDFLGTHPLLLIHVPGTQEGHPVSSVMTHLQGSYWLQRSADSKHPLALFDLGEKHFRKKQYLEALPLFANFLEASKKPVWGFPSPLFKDMRVAHAHYRLAKMIQFFQSKNRSTIPLVRRHTASMSGEAHLEQAALRDHPLAQYELGESFFSRESFDKAFYWFYTLLAMNTKKGNQFIHAGWIKDADVQSRRVKGAFYLGLMYAFPSYYDLVGLELRSPTNETKYMDHSPLVQPDERRALRWLQYADKGQHRLAPGMMYQMQYQKSETSHLLSNYLVAAAETGHPVAQYHKALLSLKRDDIQGAYEWLLRLTQAPLTSPDYEVWRLAPYLVKEKKAEAFYRLGQMVFYDKIPLERVLKGMLKTNFKEWGSAVGVPGVLSSLVPASVHEVSLLKRPAPSRLIADHREDLKVILTAFLYKKAWELGHKEALIQLQYMKMAYTDRMYKKPAQGSLLSWDLLKEFSAFSSPPQKEEKIHAGKNNSWKDRCYSLFSEFKKSS